MYLRRFLGELGFSQDEATRLYLDSQSAIDLAYNPEHHARVKHVLRRHFYIREQVEAHELTVPYVNTLDNLADFFTKALDPKAFFPMRDRIMNVQGSAP